MSTSPRDKPPLAALEPRLVDAGRGWSWLAEAFELFRRDPGTWIGIGVVYLLIMLASDVVPAGSVLMAAAEPMLAAGMMLGCHSQAAGQGLKVAHLFEGFSGKHLRRLIVLVPIYVVTWYVLERLIDVFAMVLSGFSPLPFSTDAISGQSPLSLMLRTLVLLVLYAPLAMATWLAPALMVLRGAGAAEALKSSFRCCLINYRPFLLYGAVGLVIAVAASLPLLLGWLAAMPVFFISLYTTCRDTFPPPLVESTQAPHPFV